MNNFYAISYDVLENSKSRKIIEKFFTDDNSEKLSETSYLVYCDSVDLSNLCSQIEIDSEDEKISIIQVTAPIPFPCNNISNEKISNFIKSKSKTARKLQNYDYFIQNSSN